MVAVKYNDLSLAFEFVSSAEMEEHHAYLSLDTGRIYFTSEFDPMEEELPDDFETSDRYLAIPHKKELDLGRDLVFRFAAEKLSDDEFERVQGFFCKRGAYARFKVLLESKKLLEAWYKFEQGESDKALREWCADNGIELVEESGDTA